MAVNKEVKKTLPDRRALRDKKRKEFFADHGLTRCTDPFSIAMPQDQALANVNKCLELARSIHEGETSAIDATLDEIGLLMSGFGVGSITAAGRPTMRSMDPDRLFQSFFATKLW